MRLSSCRLFGGRYSRWSGFGLFRKITTVLGFRPAGRRFMPGISGWKGFYGWGVLSCRLFGGRYSRWSGFGLFRKITTVLGFRPAGQRFMPGISGWKGFYGWGVLILEGIRAMTIGSLFSDAQANRF